jgi:hypothetical protein
MPRYQLRYLARPGAAETIEASDPENAKDLARLRLLFREPGFTIAVMLDGVELTRVTQRARQYPLRI